jgi:DNA-binding NarL/FixJ family response regulator
MDKIAIAIVDDHTLFRQGIGHLLAESGEIEVVFEASNGQDLKNKIGLHPIPEVILMDINMPIMDGYESTKWTKANYPHVKILALSMHDEDKPIIEMLKSGAGGYMLKKSKAADLLNAVRTLANQGFFINELVSERLMRNIRNDQQVKPASIVLSANEHRFLELCCSDLTYKEIAGLMNLSSHTIDNYREALFQKFAIKSRTGLVISGLKHGLIKI